MLRLGANEARGGGPACTGALTLALAPPLVTAQPAVADSTLCRTCNTTQCSQCPLLTFHAARAGSTPTCRPPKARPGLLARLVPSKRLARPRLAVHGIQRVLGPSLGTMTGERRRARRRGRRRGRSATPALLGAQLFRPPACVRCKESVLSVSFSCCNSMHSCASQHEQALAGGG